ncbi:MAG: hypothetical protein E6Q94_01590 [Burkholderiaceae bacterium]|nr:MAG: hypothetical protein E6Q94_01590 [Burkholderiaceae bacterium]
MKPNNPPAFPSATAPSVHGCWGMTLRDYFAAAAITAAAADLRKNLEEGGLTCEFIDEVNAKLLAESCYFIADAMLQCRMSGDPASAAPAATGLENELLEYITRRGYTSASGISCSRQFRDRRAEARNALESLISKGVVLKRTYDVGNPTYTSAGDQ